MRKYDIKDSLVVSNSNGYAFSVGKYAPSYVGWYSSPDECRAEQKRYYDTINDSSIDKDRVLSQYKFVQFNQDE